MPAVRLIPIDQSLSAALDRGADEFHAGYWADVGVHLEVMRQVVGQTLALVAAVPRPAVWGGYLAVDRQSASVVGSCAFKAGPTSEGSVEIAYFTFPGFEGQGYATAMAQALIAVASLSPAVRRVVAHTLPETGPSTSVLEKVGMQLIGEVYDPEDGNVWEWQYLIRTPIS
jgi:GNAT superfamily N-acetyltransferase